MGVFSIYPERRSPVCPKPTLGAKLLFAATLHMHQQQNTECMTLHNKKHHTCMVTYIHTHTHTHV